MKHFIRKGSSEADVLRHLLATMHKGITVMDPQLRLVVVNDTACRLLDLPRELIENAPDLEEVLRFIAQRGEYGPGDPEAQVRERLELARSRKMFDIERQRPDGTVLRAQGTPMPDGGFVTIYTDVTEARRRNDAVAEARDLLEERLQERTAELRRGRDLLASTVNAVNDGLVVVDESGRIVLTNNTFDRLFPSERSWTDSGENIVDVLQRLGPAGLAEALEGLDTDPETPSEFRFGARSWYRVSCRPTGEDGTVIYRFADITTFKLQHRALQQHTDKLVKMLRNEQKINEMQREFVSMASHEFRTPLAIIDSNAQRLRRLLDRHVASGANAIDDEAATALTRRLGNIRESVDRMQYLINRFLSFTQHQSGALELELKESALRPLVKAVCLRQQSLCTTHLVDTDLDALPETARIDSRLIEQCIANILSNAIKYSAGRDRIRVRGFTENGHAVIRIEDDGVGIPEHEIPKIFNRYFRASTSSGIPGTGIGLHMTDMIVSEHRGKLHVVSEVGRGTAVEIRLPHTAAPAAPPTANEATL